MRERNHHEVRALSKMTLHALSYHNNRYRGDEDSAVLGENCDETDRQSGVHDQGQPSFLQRLVGESTQSTIRRFI